MTANMPEADRRNALLVRDAMERTVAELPSVHDLVPAAVTQGRRRRARVRLTIAAGVACVAGAVVFGSQTLAVGGGAGRTVRPASSRTPSPHESPESVRPEPYRTPVHIDPTSDDERSVADLPPAERKRRAQFQQHASVLLDKLLPDSVGLIRPVDLDVSRYQGQTEDGKVFTIVFSVRPSGDGPDSRPCPSAALAAKGGSCEQATLPGGIKATSLRVLTDSPETMRTDVRFRYGHSDIDLAVEPDLDARASAPVTNEQLLAAVGDSRFLDLVRYADEHPMQKRQTTIAGG
ncbi:hypothetical protein [Streptomyces sp. MK7]|uniref:hypothetical protein n=1 Tax=Streptomyces sp. MK7 TaxID=3067635 RepID=UPI002931151E|nr:hypothetical protein [Streptomyces sp. MK7]